MPELALARQLNAIGKRAITEAVLRHATRVGAEHVLLAIVADPDAPITRRLAAQGLDYSRLVGALDGERIRSLSAAGAERVDPALLSATPRSTRPTWGASARDLLRAADKGAAKSGARSGTPGALETELVIGILRADQGTVPRALALLGVDRGALLAALAG